MATDSQLGRIALFSSSRAVWRSRWSPRRTGPKITHLHRPSRAAYRASEVTKARDDCGREMEIRDANCKMRGEAARRGDGILGCTYPEAHPGREAAGPGPLPAASLGFRLSLVRNARASTPASPWRPSRRFSVMLLAPASIALASAPSPHPRRPPRPPAGLRNTHHAAAE